MKTAALCILAVALLLSLMWGAANCSLVDELRSAATGCHIAYQGETMAVQVCESALTRCEHQLDIAVAKVETTDRLLGLSERRKRAAQQVEKELVDEAGRPLK